MYAVLFVRSLSRSSLNHKRRQKVWQMLPSKGSPTLFYLKAFSFLPPPVHLSHSSRWCAEWVGSTEEAVSGRRSVPARVRRRPTATLALSSTSVPADTSHTGPENGNIQSVDRVSKRRGSKSHKPYGPAHTHTSPTCADEELGLSHTQLHFV